MAVEPGPLGIETAAGAKEEEAWLTLRGSGTKPGGGTVEVRNRDTSVAMLVGTGVRATPPKTGVIAEIAGPTLRLPVAGVLDT